MDIRHPRTTVLLSLAAWGVAGAVAAQATGGMGPSTTGAAAAGGSPVGMVLPSSIQTGSTAPTLPGHTITSERRAMYAPWATAAGASNGRVLSRTEPAGPAYLALDSTHRGYLTRSEVQGVAGFSFDDADANKDGRLSREEFERAWSAAPAR